jgi:hypothetical protein
LLSKLSSNDGVDADRRVVDAVDGFDDDRYMAASAAELLLSLMIMGA